MKQNFSNKQLVNSIKSDYNSQLQKTSIEIDIYIDDENGYQGESILTFTESLTGIKHEFKSIANANDLNNTSFLVTQGIDKILDASTNLRDCLLRDPFF